MARRKAAPPVARPTGGRLLLELGKDALILLLTCSALFLAWQTPLVGQLRGWVAPPAPVDRPSVQQPEGALIPYALAARNSRGLYGVMYDKEGVSRAFEQLSPLLGEAFASAEPPQDIPRRQWQALLESPGVYCAYQGSPPLSILSAWLGGDGGLEGRAQSLLLAWDGEQVWLCWRDGESCYRSLTQVAYEGHLASLLEEFSPNGAAYAYSLARTDQAYAPADPDVLVAMTAPQPLEYTAASPNFTGDPEALAQLLSVLGFQSGVGSAYETAGGLTLNEGGDRLRVGDTGLVSFHAGEELRYPVASPSLEDATLAAWDLLNRAAAPWKGETDFVLTGAESSGGWIITFHGRLGGVPLLTGEEGWYARFTVANGRVETFALNLRLYTPGESYTLLPSERLASAAMNAQSLRGSGRRLTLCYSDVGAGTLSAGWIAQE